MGLEFAVESKIQSLLEEIGYEYLNDSPNDWWENRQLDSFIDEETLLECLKKINRDINDDSIFLDAINKLKAPKSISLFEKNRDFHYYLINGITIERKNLRVNPLVKIIDFENVENNSFTFCRQISYNEGRETRRADLVVYINGLPLVLMELKTFDEDSQAQLEMAYDQVGKDTQDGGYRYDIPSLFVYNSFIVLADGVNVRLGTLTSDLKRYSEWKSIDGEDRYDENSAYKLNYNIKGVFEKTRILEIIKNYLFFIEDKNEQPKKILAGYHQFFGVEKAFKSILKHKKPEGDGNAGIIWHTQGSGKSYSMLILAHKLLQEPSLNVPTIVMLTDRVDLDDQLYKTFCSAKGYLRCEAEIATSRSNLLDKLSDVKQGGIYFTNIYQYDKTKLVSNPRSNIIVMSDEAHRSHYGMQGQIEFKKNDEHEAILKYGIEKYIREGLPNATFIGFTGTPVSTKDRQTTAVYGDIIDVYDMIQSLNDGSTVKLFYEGRLAKIWTDDNVLKQIDEYYDELESEEKVPSESIEKSKKAMAKLKTILEDPDVIELLAKDIIEHYKERSQILNGKAMIVCETRLMAYRLYKKILELAPEYTDQTIIIVTNSNKDSAEMRECFKDKKYRNEAGIEFKKSDSKYKIAIVVDMWLTGFDVPDLDVMYFIKRLKQHNLMQAIARVNRVFPGKDAGGLIVDYIGLSGALDEALAQYTQRDRDENVQDAKKEIYNQFVEILSVLDEWFYKINKTGFLTTMNDSEKYTAIQEGSQFILQDATREEQYIQDFSLRLKRAFATVNGFASDEQKNNALYYLSVRSFILRLKSRNAPVSISDMNTYVSNLLADAIKGDEVKVLTKTEESIDNIFELLSAENIAKLKEKNKDYPNVFVQIVRSLLETAIRESRKHNYLKSQEYSERLKKIIDAYNDRDDTFEAETTILELVNIAGELVGDEEEAKRLGISGRERAFYDALVKDKSAKELLSDKTLQLIATELSGIVNEYATTDWSRKEATRAKMRVQIKKCLKKYNYPPEYTEDAINNVIKQAEYIAAE